MSAHPMPERTKVICCESVLSIYVDSIYTVYACTTSNNVHYIKCLEDLAKNWYDARKFKIYNVKIDPKILYYLKEYRDNGHITKATWEDLKQLVAKLEDNADKEGKTNE